MKYLKRLLLCISTFGTSWAVDAQVGGDAVYEFLDLSGSARITALGGNLITVRDQDVNLALRNPSALNQSMHQAISVNHNFHFADIQAGYASYARYLEKPGIMLHGGLQYISYGQFDLADQQGNLLGTFKASELAFVVGAGRQFAERLSGGVNLKLVQSRMESYQSLGLLIDVAGMYYDEEKGFTATAVLSNIGAQISKYTPGGDREPVPFNIQLGISKRLKYLPFRFSVIAHSLQRWNLLYDDPNSAENGSLIIGEEPNTPSAFSEQVDNFFRHFVFNGEFLLGKNETIKLRIGYNHQLRKELSLTTLRTLAGFSGGVGIKISKFTIDYGFGVYHVAGSTKHISISTNLDAFGKNKLF